MEVEGKSYDEDLLTRQPLIFDTVLIKKIIGLW